MDKITKYAEISADQINEWKTKFGTNNVFSIEVESVESKAEKDHEALLDDQPENDPTARFIIKKPSRMVLDAVANQGGKKDFAAANKILIANCVLGGDMDALENDGGVYSAVLKELTALTGKKRTAVKKL